MPFLPVEENLRQMELGREAYWLRYPHTSPLRLHWRAVAVRHCFHVLPHQTILELGAGTGLWTEHLTRVLRGENPITAAVFNNTFADDLARKVLSNTTVLRVTSLADIPAESFDYVVGTAILCHNLYAQNLRALQRILKPGGQLLFFEANHWNPQVFVKNVIPAIGRWAGQTSCQAPMRKYKLMKAASEQGYTNIEIVPFDIIHPRIPRALIRALQSASYLVEHAPLAREFCGTLYIWAKKPGDLQSGPQVNLANRPELFGAVSVVVPCHNEEMNIPLLVRRLMRFYGPYIHEIVIVNDNSKDRTAEVTLETARDEPRVKLVNRRPPNGVGRALRDGYKAATGAYILTMDSDFVQILPEFRDLFEAVADGKDGAFGSRFSYESMLINYPFAKIIANRGFHALANLLLPIRVHDMSNNLKILRAEILKNMQIEQPHFAANAETGLKPILAGYDIAEVPISWINRSIEMGSSTFRVAKVAPGYLSALMSVLWQSRGHKAFHRKWPMA